MNIKIVKNKYLNSLLLMMLFSATVHMLILFYISVMTGNFYILNYFKILDINYEILKKMLEVYKNEKLDPRDSIHLATMQINKINIIISQDSDFDKIKQIKRIDFSK